MNNFTLENFLTAISPESPCGQNLEDDFAFAQLENAAKFIGERQMGDEIIPEVEPDWKTVRALALELLARSRDIQVAMHLSCALLHTDGISGFVQGLALIRGLLEKYWDDVYPRKDPEDDYPILRINTLGNLKDSKKVLDAVARVKLTQSMAGNFSWRDIEIAQNSVNAPSKSDDIPDMALIDAAFMDTPIEYLKQQESTFNQALQHTQGIVNLISEKVGSVNSTDISPLTNLLKNISKYITEKIQQRPETELEAGGADSELMQGKTAPGGAGQTSGKNGGIHNRQDVVRSIDAICTYFERYEPSSPVPFLLLRAKKMLTMNFMEIILELAPDAVNQAENICGAQKPK